MGRFRTRGKNHNNDSLTQAKIDEEREAREKDTRIVDMAKGALLVTIGHTGQIYTPDQLLALIKKIKQEELRAGTPVTGVKPSIPFNVTTGTFGRWTGKFGYSFNGY